MQNVRPIKARISAQAGVTRVDVYDDIGEGGWFSEGLTAKSFANQLSGVSGPLEVHINSGGGDVWDGISIKNAIETHSGHVTTVVDGIAASIASVIAQAGTDRVVMPGAMLMIHEAFTYAGGNAAELAKTAATLDEVSANLAAIYARAAGGTPEEWRAAMKEETWYTADQAVEAGLADRTGEGAAVLGRIAAQLRALPQAAAPQKPKPVTRPEATPEPTPPEPVQAAVVPPAEAPKTAPTPAIEPPPAAVTNSADDKGTQDHADGLPAWLAADTAPYPAWLNPAKEATK